MTGRYDVSYISRELCGADLATFRFSRPDGYDFKPGQWFRLTLETAEGRETQTLSHASAPQDDYLELTTRLSGSAFKNALLALQTGDNVEIVGPGGRLSIREDAEKIAFLVGGVGITPIRSILRDAFNRGRAFADALLLYGNRDATCVPFATELLGMESIGVRTVLCYERPPDGWEGESGFITAQTVLRHVDASDGRPFVVAGPPAMVGSMERVLDELGVAEERRLIERFGVADQA